MIKKYSLKKDGADRLTPHFRVREFRCKDGSDEILIDERLPKLLEQIRVYAEAAVTITSAYRTEAYNARPEVGGARGSQHTTGTAADIITSGRTVAEIAKFAQAIGAGGVGLYTKRNFVHVDTRAGHSYWKNTGSGDRSVSGHGGACPYSQPKTTVKKGSKGDGVRWIQWWLRLWGYSVTVDGICGNKTETAIEHFQKRIGLTVDGLAGAKTRNARRGVL